MFYKVKRLSGSKLESHQHLNAILSAVTEVIKQRSGSDQALILSPTSYFASFMSLLSEKQVQSEEEITAIVTLLAIVFPKLQNVDLSWLQHCAHIMVSCSNCTEIS